MPVPPDPDPAVKPLVYLGVEMRKHRKRADLSQKRVARITQFSQSLVGYIERGERTPSQNFMQRYDDAVGSGGELVRLWARLTRGASPRWFRNWLEVEQEAHALHSWEPLYFPGLLQTDEYADLVIRGEPGITEDQVERAVMARMERQAIFDRPDSPMLRVLLDEGVLHRPIGGKKVMHSQLRRLLEAVESPRIGIQIVPLALGVTTGLLGGFAIAQISGSPDTVYIESATHGNVTDNPEDVEAIHSRYDMLRAAAQPEHLSVGLIREAEKLWT
ncbi:transcriptional regulator [Sphaerisporangium siamense]|uniref:Transcriptional regulator with XRE-family HTH domain n=1 Tax=Sphaerisporangium siamense TaxID=795645 RepID=A0A7W7GCP8_9ACTN|nr:helix-turn-helix transcriptional regulator [Sphaerisporangium siamense]MBB4703734.1 transcriptional regulator with XRE-family HTH domain [Sphaerisporangium siamense]GII82202.1 transcriptional regulator [Sphaerisporangium siamense]